MTGAALDERVRLFVALELPDDVVTGLVSWREDIVGAGRPPIAGRRGGVAGRAGRA